MGPLLYFGHSLTALHDCLMWGACVYIIPKAYAFMVVNLCKLFTPTHCCLPVYTAGTWRFCQRSICNTPLYLIFQKVHLWTFSLHSPLPPHTSYKECTKTTVKIQQTQRIFERLCFHHATSYHSIYYPNYFFILSQHSWSSHMHTSKYNTTTSHLKNTTGPSSAIPWGN